MSEIKSIPMRRIAALLLLAILSTACGGQVQPTGIDVPAGTLQPVLSTATHTQTIPPSPASSPLPLPASPVVTWSRERDGVCASLAIGLDTLAYGECGAAPATALTESLGRALYVESLAEQYTPFDTETPAGKLVFAGHGPVTATPWEQRAIAEWAQLVYDEAISGRGGAAWGLAIAWNREGGIAGFCDGVAIYLSGEAIASTCKATPAQGNAPVYLSSSQLRQLYQWVDGLKAFELEQSDPATADGMHTSLVLYATGQVEATADDQQAMTALAEDVLAQATVEQNPANMESARQMVRAFLQRLAAGDYAGAALLYGGSYQTLIDMNPERDPQDSLGLFEDACTRNGFVCSLALRNFVHEAQLSETEFRLTVELQTADGALFALGPCCGEDPNSSPPLTQFDFHVQWMDDKFLVMDLPVYVP